MNSASRCISESVSRLHPSEPRLTSALTVCGGGGGRRVGVEEGGGDGRRRVRMEV